MSEQLLNNPDVRSLHQSRSEGVSENVRSDFSPDGFSAYAIKHMLNLSDSYMLTFTGSRESKVGPFVPIV